MNFVGFIKDNIITGIAGLTDIYSDNQVIGDVLVKILPDYVVGSYQNYYYKDNQFKLYPTKPSEAHYFDFNSENWVVDQNKVNILKENLKKELEKVRIFKENSIIRYTNKNLDADAEAIKNINGKLREIEARETLNIPFPTDLLFWRDADNVTHQWNDVTVYKNWLKGLVIAIAERSTRLYAVSWAKKAEVNAIQDVNLLINYDINSGWELV